MIINPIDFDSRMIRVMYTAPPVTTLGKFGESENSQLNSKTIKINIPQRYYQAPIISHLSKYYGLEVNILAANLSTDAGMNGCFSLQLLGNNPQISSALSYLSILDIVVNSK